MNRHCYRIIFSRARRMLMVVSELARSRGGDAGRGAGATAASCTAVLRPLTLALWFAAGLVSATAQAGSIVADRGAAGRQQPTVMQSGNGLPQVNIQTPNDQGLSHNKYSQFDVGERGAILNNSQHATATQLAGQVAGNPWLAKGSAKVILNEVNSMNPSQLRGFVEVAGKKADVIIANPAGITCSGCGFVNAGRSTLAAGHVRLENGQVAGYDVDRGRITISGSGMNGSGQDYTRLIARAVEVNARLQAGDLTVTVGHNRTDADGNVIAVKADDAGGRPQFAVDTAALGGMYANRITLVGTERGVGVRNAGEMGATQGGFTLTADGKLTNSGTLYAQQDLALKTARLDNRGQISTDSHLKIASQGDVINRGTLSAGGDLKLDSSGRLHSQGGSVLTAGDNATVTARIIESDAGSAMGAGIDSKGQATRSGSLAIGAREKLISHGTHLSHNDLTVSGREVDISGSHSRAATVTVTAREGDLNADDTLIDAQQATLSTAQTLTTRRSAIAASQLTISATEKLDNRGGTLISRGEQRFTLNSQQIDNSGGTLASIGDFSLTSHSLNNTGGQLGSENGRVVIQSDDISGAQGKILAAGDLMLSGQQILLDGGLTQGQQVHVQGTSLSLQNGQLLQTGKGEMQIKAIGHLSARDGIIQSAGAIDLRAGSLDNNRGRIASNGKLRLDTGNLDNTSGTLDLSGALDNRDGILEGETGLTLNASGLDNTAGRIATPGAVRLDLRGGELINAQTNADGLGILSGEALTLTTGDFNNQQGQLQARNLDLTADNINNQAGSLVASERINLKGTTLDNTQGLLSADGGSASLTLTDQLTNRKGTLQSQQALALQATSLDNDGGKVLSAASQIVGQVSGALSNLAGSLLAGTALDLHAAAINNQQGVIAATHGDNHLTTTGLLNNQGGDIESSQRLTLDAAGVDNHGGQLLAGDAMQISADGLTNSAGLIQAGDALSIDTRGGVLLNADTLSDTSGIRAGGALTLSAGDVDNRNGLISGNQLTGQGLTWNNQGGEIDSLQTLSLSGTALSNGKGLVSAGEGDLTASFTQTLDNQQGTLQSSQNLRVAAATLNNSSGTLLAKNALQLKGEKIDNPRGVLQSGGSITLTAGSLDNQDGAVSSQNGALDVNVAGAMNNQRGILQSTTGNGLLTIGGPLDNQQGSIIAHGALTLSSGDIDNRKGALLAGSLDLTSQQLNNQAGLIQGRDGLSIDTHGNQLDNSETQGDQTGLRSGGALNLTAGDVNNQAWLIAGKLLKLVAQGVNNQTGAIDSAGLTASVDALNNTAGLLFAIGDAQVTARQSVQNQQGLIKAGQALNLSASEIDNQNTRGSGQGIEAQDLALNAASLNNQQGALRAGDALQASISKQLNNQNGLISSQNSLTLGQPGSRPVLNNGGDIVADGNVDLWLGQLDGGGRIVSGGDLSLDSVSALNQSGTLAADGDFTLNSHGNALTNSGTLSAGHQLNLTTGQLSNQQSGDINAATTHIDASGIFNQGVIDGGDVLLHADRLHNTGMGRLYGDRLTLDARTLLNDKTGETAATIAARGDLTIATDRLSNQDHGLIYSNGGLSIGGRLNDAGQLTGQAARVENLSATIEAMGDVHIDAAQTENRDTHLTVSPDLKTVSVTPNVLEVELCSGEKWNEGCGRTDGQHYRFKGSLVEFNQDGSSPVAFNFDKDGRSYAFDNKGNRVTVDVDGTPQYVTLWQDNDKDIIRYNLPGVSGDGRRFNIFSYQQSVKEQEVSGQDSAVIRSGGDLTLSGSLHNKDSQLVAGQDLRIHGSVDNDETTIRQVISKDGVVVRAGKRKAHRQTHFEGQGVYQPPLQETDVPLHLTVQQRGQGAGDGRTIAQQQPTIGGGKQASTLTGAAALAQPVQQTLVTEVALPPGPGPLPDGNSSSGVPIQKTAEGLTKVTPSDAAGLTATPAGNVGTTQDGAQPVKVPPQDNWVLRSVSGPVKLPDNSLFMLHPGSDSHYLVETDPRFTDGKQALSSSAFYSQDQLQKRLGDGDYEQLLVRNQVMKATGQRYLSGFSDDEDQYRALLASGRAFTERFGIMPGVDLTAEQMAQVTGDMVIMVNLPVTLADGSTQVVSVPKLYARVQPGSLKSSGSLLAGNNVRINTADKVINGGSINGRELTSVSAGSLLNSGDISGNLTRLVAAGDIVNRGGQLKGGEQLALQAGKDILSLTGSGQRGSESWLGRQAGIAVTGDGGALSLNAGHDIQLTASVVSNRGSDSTTRLRAGHDILLDTATTRHATDYTRNDQNYDRTRESREVGSTIDAGGSLMMQSGHDMSLRAASVTATQDATLLAGHDLSLQSGEETWDQSTRAKWTKHHFLSKTTTKIQSETHQNGALSSTLSGDTVTAQAGHDMTMSGSNIAGTHDVTLSAGHNLTLTTAAESSHTASVEQKKKSGFSGTGGLGFSLGHSSQKLTHDDSSNVQKGSVAGSSEGSLTLLAGNAATVHGSDLVAGQDMTVQGKNVSITTAENGHTELTQRVTKSSGLTLSLGGTVGSALNTATQQVKAAHKEEDGRLAALKGTQAALTGYSATQAARLAAAGGSAGGDVAGLSLSLGRQRSASEQRLEERTSSGSRLQAGRDMHIAATGGDLSAEGAQLKAGRDMTLSARRDITLTSGQNSTQSSSHNRSHGGSVGMGVGAGSGSAGLSASLSANHGRGHENGSSLTHAETTADAGRTLSLSSGRDAALQGAQLSGEAIRADIGRDLQIASEQESSRFDMKQTGGSAGLGVTWGAGSPASASASGSRDKMHSRYDSVQKQSGLFAGKGGFDVSVGNHAQLDGGVIASTADAAKNRLDTGTLGFSDIENSADFTTGHQGAGLSSGGNIGGQFIGNMANGLLVGANHKGHADSSTHAAVSDGTITVRDKDNQQQDVADLSRDTAHAGNGLSPIFNKEKEQNRLKEAQLIGEIGSQIGDIARTQGELSGLKAAKEKHGNLSADQLRETQEYKAEMQKYGTGSALQQGIQAATAAVQGLAGGDLAKAIAGGSAPYIASIIGSSTLDPAGKVMAHAAVNAALAAAQGNNALAGAAGSATAEISGMIALEFTAGVPES